MAGGRRCRGWQYRGVVAPESYPVLSARTRRFSLGRPRTLTVSPDGARVVFCRSAAGDDPVNALWVLDVATGTERQVVDPVALLGSSDQDLPYAERRRRERMRESSSGVTGYATDRDARVAVFALSGRLFRVDLADAAATELPTAGPVVDPRLSPDGATVAYASEDALHVVSDGTTRPLVAEDGVTWGLAEFIASEELDRFRGYWWAPESDRLIVARVDESPVDVWWISDPANPGSEPVAVRYPHAGSPNADVQLSVVRLSGDRVAVDWDRAALPYVVDVRWGADGPPLLTAMSRDQRLLRVLAVDPDDGSTRVVHEETDHAWVDVTTGGVPAWLPDGRLLTVTDETASRRLCVDGVAFTPETVQVLAVVESDVDGVLVEAALDDPADRHVLRIGYYGAVSMVTTGPGVHRAVAAGGTTVVAAAGLDHFGTTYTVYTGQSTHEIVSHASTPPLTPAVRLLRLGSRELRSALVLPTGHEPGTRLPVLLNPYGGPHSAMVQSARAMFLESQWFADQGFAVLVVDGRGTPYRSPEWERSVHRDLAGPVLTDQVDALHAAADLEPDLDLARVAMRGWSFGGFLSALAVLRRPDVFHAAIAGAPVTDQRLYDTGYTERYLGTDPEGADQDAYERSSVIADAPNLRGELLIIHGLADDNVVSAHTLRLSSALLAAGKAHTVLPLTGITHMATDETIAANLLKLQVAFLHRALS